MIALITPTGVRQEQFKLCAAWMLRQDYKDPVTWFIVDDGAAVTTDNVQPDFRDNWNIVKIYPKPSWFGQNTQGRNILAGIEALKSSEYFKDITTVFIIEDDDYYKANYLTEMVNRMANFSLIGETNTIYYNVKFRQYCDNNNRQHSSLFQTAFSVDIIPLVLTCLNHKFIDAELWAKCQNKYLFHAGMLSLGIKGMAGRGGIGAGHGRGMAFLNDSAGQYLNQIIGEDARRYEQYYSSNSVPQHRLFGQRGV